VELQCYEASPLLYILTDVCPGCAHVCVHVCVCMNRYFYSSGTHLRVSSSNGLLRHYLHMQRQQETKEPTQCSWTERTKPELCEASFKRFSSSVGVTEPESHREGGDDTAKSSLPFFFRMSMFFLKKEDTFLLAFPKSHTCLVFF